MRDRGDAQKTHIEAQAAIEHQQASLFEPPPPLMAETTPQPPEALPPPSWAESLARYLAGR